MSDCRWHGHGPHYSVWFGCSAKDMAFNRRIELLKGLAQLVRWADSLYLSEARRSLDTDPSSTHFDPLAEAVKVTQSVWMNGRLRCEFIIPCLELGHQCVKLVFSSATIREP